MFASFIFVSLFVCLHQVHLAARPSKRLAGPPVPAPSGRRTWDGTAHAVPDRSVPGASLMSPVPPGGLPGKESRGGRAKTPPLPKRAARRDPSACRLPRSLAARVPLQGGWHYSWPHDPVLWATPCLSTPGTIAGWLPCPCLSLLLCAAGRTPLPALGLAQGSVMMYPSHQCYCLSYLEVSRCRKKIYCVLRYKVKKRQRRVHRWPDWHPQSYCLSHAVLGVPRIRKICFFQAHFVIECFIWMKLTSNLPYYVPLCHNCNAKSVYAD